MQSTVKRKAGQDPRLASPKRTPFPASTEFYAEQPSLTEPERPRPTRLQAEQAAWCKADAATQLYRPLLERRRREPGNLGQLGDCVFMEPKTFFRHQAQKAATQPLREELDFDITYALGDIHGDFLLLLAALRMLKLIDEQGSWSAKKRCALVLCGDLLDSAGRGCQTAMDNPREEVDILQFLHFLRSAAHEQGSAVVTLLGNHDVARVFHWQGMDKYVSPEQVQGWGGEQEMWRFFRTVMRVYFARFFLLTVRVKQYVFMHAGVPNEALAYESAHPGSLRKLNQFMRQYLAQEEPPEHEGFFRQLLLPVLQGRGFMNPTERNDHAAADEECKRRIDHVLRAFGISGGFVVGHSVQARGLRPHCNGKVWRVDFGMSRAFCADPRERPLQALKIKQRQDKTLLKAIGCRTQGNAAFYFKRAFAPDGTELVRDAAGKYVPLQE